MSTAIRSSSSAGSSSTPSETQVSALGGLPKAIGEVRYIDDRSDRRRVPRFQGGARRAARRLRRGVHELAVARHRRHGDQERALRHARGLSRGARQGAAGRVRGDRRARLRPADRRARPRARAPHHLQGPAGRRVRRLRREGRRDDQRGADERAARPGAPACVLGQFESPHDSDVPLDDILPIVQQAKVGGFVLPFANPRHAHEFKLLRRHSRSPTTRSSSPA